MRKFSFDRQIFSKWLLISISAIASLVLVANASSCKKNHAKANPPEEEKPIVKIIPNDGKDDTQEIQNAIDEAAENGGGTVTLPAGDYNVNAELSISLKNKVTLSMDPGARLIANASNKTNYAIIKALNVHDATVSGGQIIGERDSHIGTTGEWGMGVDIRGCDNIKIENVLVKDCWGDGIYIGSSSGTPSTNISIVKVLSRNNRRQGLSIIEVNGVTIDSCEFSNTNGTDPEDGIDIEPNNGTSENITITHCEIFSNLKGNGVEINQKTGTIVRNVTIRNNHIYNNVYSAYCGNADRITFTDNTLYANKYISSHPYKANCTNSVWEPNTYN